MGYYYEKYDPESGKMKMAPGNDYDGSITGRCVFNLKAWFDENPDTRKRLGYVKHITHGVNEIDYDKATQYLEPCTVAIDEYTVEDVYYVSDKSEEMLAMEEIMARLGSSPGSSIVFMPADEGLIGFDNLQMEV